MRPSLVDPETLGAFLTEKGLSGTWHGSNDVIRILQAYPVKE